MHFDKSIAGGEKGYSGISMTGMQIDPGTHRPMVNSAMRIHITECWISDVPLASTLRDLGDYVFECICVDIKPDLCQGS